MRPILLSLLSVLLAVTAVPAEDPVSDPVTDPGTVIAEAIRTYEQIEALRTEMHDAVGDLTDEKRAYELAIRELEKPPKTQEQLDELSADIQRQKESLRSIRISKDSKASIDYSKKRIRDLTLMLDAGRLTTDAQRDAFRKKCQPRIDALDKKIQAIQEPYQQRIRAIEEPNDARDKALADVLRQHLLTPEATYPGSEIDHFSATPHMAFGASHWKDCNDTQIAWAHIRIRSLSEIEDYHREHLLDGKYPIQSLSDGSIWVWAGHFLITFVADDDGLKGKETIQQAIHDFIDLEGLAMITAEVEPIATGSNAE